MSVETRALVGKPYPFAYCPQCHEPFQAMLRGCVQRPKRFLLVLWRQPYCALICWGCKNVVGWEEP